MEKAIDNKVYDFKRIRFVYRWWYRVIVWLSAGAVFITTYFLMLPALTANTYGTTEIIGSTIIGDVLHANNVYKIEAVLGPKAGYNMGNSLDTTKSARTKAICGSQNVNTIFIHLPTRTDNATEYPNTPYRTINLGYYFYGSGYGSVIPGESTGTDLDPFGIDLSEWCAIAVEYNGYYEGYYVSEVVIGTAGSKSISYVYTLSQKGFVILVKKDFLNAGNKDINNNKMRMYVPQCDDDKTNYGARSAANPTWWKENHDYCHLNETPLKNSYSGETISSLLNVTDFRPSYASTNSNEVKWNSKLCYGYVTFSPYMDQNDVANAVPLAGDVPEENLAENITFRLFDYSNNINKASTGWSLFNTTKTIADDCVPLAQYFNFRNKEHTSEAFTEYWGKYAACMCSSATSYSQCQGSSGHKSILHKNDTYDQDGFTENHATAYYRVNYRGYPIIYLTKNANNETVSGAPSTSVVTSEMRSLEYLFNQSFAQERVLEVKLASGAVKQYNPTNTILQYNPDTSTYSYDSAKNAVDYSSSANKFYVRGYTERNDDSAQIGVDMTNYYDFLPFNYGKGIITETYSVYNNGFESKHRASSFQRKNIYYTYDKNDNVVANTDTYNNVNFWFGMTMEFTFIQGKDGKVTYVDSNGNTHTDVMKFTFSGDDDVWVFIDGVKVLDLGGTHGEATGQIDFSTGQIKQYLSWNGGNESDTATSFPTTLRKCFDLAGTKYVNSVEWDDTNTTFEDYSVHTLKFYYLERGACVANCSIEFNLQTFGDNSLIVGKELTSSANGDALSNAKINNEYKFKVLKNDKSTLLIEGGTPYKILENGAEVGSGTVDANGIFTLKHGQQAIIENIWNLTNGDNDGEQKYYVEEIIPASQKDQYSKTPEYTIKFDASYGSDDTYTEQGTATVINYADGSVGYVSGQLSSAETQTVTFTNYINESKLRNLSISKEVEKYPEGTGTGSFEIQVKLDGELLPVGTIYNISGTSEKRTVTTAGVVTVNAGETIIIKGILDGTTYEVQELAASMLTGYVVYYNGTLKTNESGTIDSANVTVAVLNKQSGDNVQITVNKTLENVTENSDFDFVFTMKPISKDTNGAFVDSGETGDDKTITINAAVGGSANAVYTLQYLAEDYVVGDTYCYYKITETIGDVSVIAYDECAYVVTVKVSKSEAGVLSASIDSILKFADGDITGTGTSSGAVDFVNELLLYSLPTTGGSGEKLSASQFVIGYVLILAAIVGLLCCVAARNKKDD